MIAILCPLKKEWEIVRKNIDNKEILLEVGGHGKVNFAIKATELLLREPRIKTLICLGAGGSLSSEVSPFDVVVAEKTIEHDYCEMFSSPGNLPQVKGDQFLLNKTETCVNENFLIHRGIIASGDEDIISSERAQQIVEKTQAIAVAWEGIGGAKACREYERSFIEIRGITDNCSGSVSQDFLENLKKAMENATSVVNEIIKDLN